MFGKKKAAAPPYILQVLTTEYLIEGTVPGSAYLVVGAPLNLTSAQILPTRAAGVPPQALAQFTVLGAAAVAFIPRVELDQLEQYAVWKQYSNPLSGVFYVGPYMIRGRMMVTSLGLPKEEAPVFDVHITCQVPGTSWAGLYAPFALVNTFWLHGYLPE